MLLNENQIERLMTEVCRLLEEIGLRVETDEIACLLQKRGCKPLANGRLRIPRELVSEVIAVQKERFAKEKTFTAESYDDYENRYSLEWLDREEPSVSKRNKVIVRTGPNVVIEAAFSHGPTRYYDIEQNCSVDITPEIADEMVRLADAMPEVAIIQPFWTRGGRPEVQSVERLVRSLKLSRHIAPMDVMNPAEHKYMIEIGEIISGEPKSLQFVLPGQCISPPLTLSDLAAQCYLELARLGIRDSSVATMTNMGVSAPVTCWGAVAQAVAEVFAGWVTVYSIWTESRIRASICVVSLDMATGQATMVSPEMAWVNAAGREFIDRLVGGKITGTGTQYAATSTEPGFQTVCENIYMAYAIARLEKRPVSYRGAGQLASAGVGCPEQLMLDIEAARAMRALEQPAVPLDDEAFAFDATREVINEKKSFLDHEHTLAHFREWWRPKLIRWDGTESGSERAVLKRAHEAWKDNLSHYEPPGWSDDVLRALERVRKTAIRDLT